MEQVHYNGYLLDLVRVLGIRVGSSQLDEILHIDGTVKYLLGPLTIDSTRVALQIKKGFLKLCVYRRDFDSGLTLETGAG